MSKEYKLPIILVSIGFAVRLLFMFFFAELYFSRENIFVDGDTSLWTTMFTNWYKTGVLTLDPNHDYGYFGRTPGYTFFIGGIYLITGLKWATAFKFIAWAQIIIDSIAVLAIYKTALTFFNSKRTALITGLLYAIYPFVIVWSPVIYSESLSVSTLIIGFYFLVRNRKYDSILAGALISLAILCRPQILPIIFIIGVFFLHQLYLKVPKTFNRATLFFLTVAVCYGSWPLRNYLNHDKLVLTQDIRSFKTAGEDWLAFTEYIYSVKAEWEPQFTNLISNKDVTFPANAYTNYEDSLKLEKAIHLAKNCGSSFSNWKGYWKESFSTSDPNCNEEIAQLFHELKESQIEANPLNFYLLVPLQNLKKALFKLSLYKPSSTLVKVVGIALFSYRTLLLILGIIGSVLMFKNKTLRPFAILIFGYFAFLYLILCFGVGPQFRNIEMRYFLPADVLLLIPAAYLFSKINLFKIPFLRNFPYQ